MIHCVLYALNYKASFTIISDGFTSSSGGRVGFYCAYDVSDERMEQVIDLQRAYRGRQGWLYTVLAERRTPKVAQWFLGCVGDALSLR